MSKQHKSASESTLPEWLQGFANPFSRYFDQQALINDLNSLSDHLLEDAGLCRESIEEYAQSITGTIDNECCKIVCQRVIKDGKPVSHIGKG